MQELIRYRLLHEFRQFVNLRAPLWGKLRLVLAGLIAPVVAWIMVSLCSRIVASIRGSAGGLSGQSFFGTYLVGTAIAVSLFYLVLSADSFREIGLSKDLEFFHVRPVGSEILIRYRLFFALLRSSCFVLAAIVCPIYLAFSFSSGPSLALHICSFLAFLTFAAIAAFWTALQLVRLSRGAPLSRSALSVLLNLLVSIYGLAVLTTVFNPYNWNGLPEKFKIAHPPAFCVAFLALIWLLAACRLWKSLLRLWPLANVPAKSRIQTTRSPCGTAWIFPSDRSWAIFQKDVLEWLRNPAYRSALVGCGILFMIPFLAQWKRGTTAPGVSTPSLSCSLAIMYLWPFLMSVRTVSQEYHMLDFYRLVLLRTDHILDKKLKVQMVVNWLIVAILAIPCFAFFNNGAPAFYILYFYAAAILCVPVFTVLSIALGTFFRVSGGAAHPLGFRWSCLVIYVLLVIPLYSFLLNFMHLGALIYLVCLTMLALCLYLLARRSLRSA